MSQQITTSFINQYRSGLELQLQQNGSRLRPFVRVENQSAEFDFYDSVGPVEANEVTTRHGDTQYTDTPHLRRRVGLRMFDTADLIDRADKIKTLNDPTNAYAKNQAMALGRSADRVLISAATGVAWTGKDGNTPISFPNEQIIAANLNEDGTTGTATNLTWGKLRLGRRKLEEAEVLETGEIINVVYTALQKQALLKIAEEKNVDGLTMKALESGEVGELMGFRFIRTELLTKVGNIRDILMFPPSGLLLSVGSGADFGLTAQITPMPGKRYSTQVYSAEFYGGTRMDEKKMIALKCDETKL